jgi:catechol 2,3-dioxygenase-like lactoylglutathione lyase family enzyme
LTAVSITVENMEQEIAFFENVLTFKKIKDETIQGKQIAQLYGLSSQYQRLRIATLRLGDATFRLLDFDGPDSRPFASDFRSNDLRFQHIAIVVTDMEAAYQQLLKNNVTHVSTAPQTLPDYLPNAAGIKAFYFRDPEGHNLELIWFPPSKGNPKWHAPTQTTTPKPLFQGIDHTAIAIANTDTSMSFYRDLFGLVQGGHSENYGTEQEHLNQVFGARLDINGLHADTGFGLEFLRYIAPPSGRSNPTDSRPTDLWHYQTEYSTNDLDGFIQELKSKKHRIISQKAIQFGQQRVVLLQDPDGHSILVAELVGK